MLTSLVLVMSLGAAPASTGSQNLLVLARAWEQVRLFHPWLYEREVDWDQAWLTHAPRAEAADRPEALEAVVGQMLGSLKDPLTGVRPVTKQEPREGPLVELRRGVPVINTWSTAFSKADAKPFSEQLETAVKGQPRVVFDLRGTNDFWLTVDDLRVPELGPSRDGLSLGLRLVAHHGYASGSDDTFATVFEERLPRVVRKSAPSPRRYAFVVDPDSRLPSVAAAMQRLGEAFIVSTGPTDERLVVDTVATPLSSGAEVRVRATSLVGDTGFAPDLVVPAGQSAIDAAVALVLGKQPVKAPPKGHAVPARRYVDPPSDAAYPSRAQRQLAAVRVWMAARRFWAYPHLANVDFDALFVTFVQRLSDAPDAEAYALAVAELAAQLPDAHVTVSGPTLRKLNGDGHPGLELRVIEGQFVVWKSLEAAVQRGDVVLALDGRPVAEREAEIGKRIAASHAEGLRAKTCWFLLAGPVGSKVKLTLGKPGGRTEVVELERTAFEKRAALEDPPTGPHWRVLPGNLGYVDLVHLEVSEVDAALEDLADTRALIIDDRGYPHGAAFELGPRLDVKHPSGVAQFYKPRVISTAETTRQEIFMVQSLPPTTKRLYTKPTVTLIDDQAISHAEHSGLILEAYAGTTFVGSPTLGANGNITRMNLPGDLTFIFTGLDTRHADGRQLQRIGLVPHVPARPTIAGIRAGKDEVLEAAVKHLEAKPGPKQDKAR